MRAHFLLSLLALAPHVAKAALPDSLHAARIRTNATGLKVLLAWGAVSTAGGFAGAAVTDGEEARRFYQMNAFWGVVNLAIAGWGYRNVLKEQRQTCSPEEAFRKYKATRRVFAINAGLDLLYIGTGLYLRQRAERPAAESPALLTGYGNAIVLQGAALLLFDGVMYLAQGRLKGHWREWAGRLGPADRGVGLGWKI